MYTIGWIWRSENTHETTATIEVINIHHFQKFPPAPFPIFGGKNPQYDVSCGLVTCGLYYVVDYTF